MDNSIFLARVIGLYMVIIDSTMLINPDSFGMINNMLNDAPLMFLGSVIALIIGILLIVSHNIWHADWRVLITIVAWITFIKGFTNTVFPHYALTFNNLMMANHSTVYVALVISLLIGIFLCYKGFFAKQ